MVNIPILFSQIRSLSALFCELRRDGWTPTLTRTPKMPFRNSNAVIVSHPDTQQNLKRCIDDKAKGHSKTKKDSSWADKIIQINWVSGAWWTDTVVWRQTQNALLLGRKTLPKRRVRGKELSCQCDFWVGNFFLASLSKDDSTKTTSWDIRSNFFSFTMLQGWDQGPVFETRGIQTHFSNCLTATCSGCSATEITLNHIHRNSSSWQSRWSQSRKSQKTFLHSKMNFFFSQCFFFLKDNLPPKKRQTKRMKKKIAPVIPKSFADPEKKVDARR